MMDNGKIELKEILISSLGQILVSCTLAGFKIKIMTLKKKFEENKKNIKLTLLCNKMFT